MRPVAQRFQEFRALQGLTQKDLAAVLGVGQPSISGIERGSQIASDDYINRICDTYGVDESFFFKPSRAYRRGELNFRSNKLPAVVHDAVNSAFGDLEEEGLERLGSLGCPSSEALVFDRPHRELLVEEIDDRADATRLLLGHDVATPVPNVTRLFERAGVGFTVLSVPGHDLLQHGVDGLSSPAIDDRGAVIGYVEGLPGDRVRFTRAHEGGHLVLHRRWRPDSEMVREREANRFASAFLFPRAAAVSRMHPGMTLLDFAKLKSQWGVSIQALVVRAHTLSVISDARYRSLMIQISSRGWRKAEPVEVGIEQPVLLQSSPPPKPAGKARLPFEVVRGGA